MGSYLPEAFKSKMNHLLGKEYAEFIASYEDTRLYGLRVNTLKCSVEHFLELTSMELEPIAWVPTGFYYREEERPGKHLHYHAGLYYIQEPSAMAPAELLDVRPGERVLDLCAAPGGKSTQIAAKLGGQGILVTNDIHSDRVKALVKNIELSGIRNAVVLNEQPEKLQHVCQGYFDKILIDAPCSGEGMFRKEEDMAKAWQPDWVERYAGMQRDLLRQAAVMLKPGGRMVYSTCTFSPEENEAMIAEFVASHPDFRVVTIPQEFGFRSGRPDWVEISAGDKETELGHAGTNTVNLSLQQAAQQVAGTIRLWPHHLWGEGHFVAVLEHQGGFEAAEPEKQSLAVEVERTGMPAGTEKHKQERLKKQSSSKEKGMTQRGAVVDLQLFYAFMQELAPEVQIPRVILHGEHVYAAAEEQPDWSGIRVIRPGWYMGSVRKQRFEPSHALAMGLKLEEAARSISLTQGDPAALRYLKGETLEISEDRVHCKKDTMKSKGYCLVAIDGYPVGWGKWLDGMLKNEYPPGWRWT